MDSPLANKQWEKYTWTSGEEITAVKLNAIEQKLEDLHGPAMHAIRYDIDQDLTEEEKQQVKKNFNIDSAIVGSHAMGENDKNKAYILGTTTAPVADSEVTATMVADPGVYLDTDSGSLTITGAFSRGRKENTTIGTNSFAFGEQVEASGSNSHVEGQKTRAIGDSAHAEGIGLEDIRTSTIVLTGARNTTVYTYDKLPTGFYGGNTEFYYILNNNRYYLITNINEYKKEITLPQTLSSAAITSQTFNICALGGVASGMGAHSEGAYTIAGGTASHAEGHTTNAIGNSSHAEGMLSRARGLATHAEGCNTEARSPYSHAEGRQTIAMGSSSHVEGHTTNAIGSNSHAEGQETVAEGLNSHAEGYATSANGDNSHAEGEYTIAKNKSQHVFGKYNKADSSIKGPDQDGNYIEIVGNGTASDRSNARTLDWSGNEWLAGTLTANGRMLDVFIQGTQGNDDGKTAAWKGNAPFSALHDGQIIAYWLPVESADSNVTLELTLTGGMSLTTGAIPVYINGTTRVKTHIPPNNIVVMVYRENVSIKNSSGVASNYTGWWILRSQDTTTNTYDRTQYKMEAIAAEAVPQATIGVFNNAPKLIKLAKNAAFDITKPILYVSTAYKADDKRITNYIQYGIPFDLTQTISSFPDSTFTGAAGATVYIEGTLSGIMFTPLYIIAGTPKSSTNTYILLGHLSTATKMCLPAEHPFFGFKNNVFTRI